MVNARERTRTSVSPAEAYRPFYYTGEDALVVDVHGPQAVIAAMRAAMPMGPDHPHHATGGELSNPNPPRNSQPLD